MTHTLRPRAAALAVLSSIALPPQTQAQISFDPSTNFSTGDVPQSVAMGDLQEPDMSGDLLRARLPTPT